MAVVVEPAASAVGAEGGGAVVEEVYLISVIHASSYASETRSHGRPDPMRLPVLRLVSELLCHIRNKTLNIRKESK